MLIITYGGYSHRYDVPAVEKVLKEYDIGIVDATEYYGHFKRWEDKAKGKGKAKKWDPVPYLCTDTAGRLQGDFWLSGIDRAFRSGP